MMRNAEGRSPRVAKAAFRRLVALSAAHLPGTVEHDCWAMIHAVEELRRGRRKVWRMNRLRPKIAEVGEIRALADCAAQETEGFQEILDYGMPELTAEAIVLRHPGVFDDALRTTARRRLDRAGVSVSEDGRTSAEDVFATRRPEIARSVHAGDSNRKAPGPR